MKKERPTTRALKRLATAKKQRALAGQEDTHWFKAESLRVQAEVTESLATKDLEIPPEAAETMVATVGWERMLPAAPAGSDLAYQNPTNPLVRHVAKSTPDLVTAEATCQRMELAANAGCLETALEAAQESGARSALEKMLVHQMAAAHKAAFVLIDKGLEMVQYGDGRRGSDPVEACRLMNTAARMMGAYQDGVTTLARVRTGGRQVVTVQHVHVNEGGQAVVAGNVSRGGGGPTEGDEDEE